MNKRGDETVSESRYVKGVDSGSPRAITVFPEKVGFSLLNCHIPRSQLVFICVRILLSCERLYLSTVVYERNCLAMALDTASSSDLTVPDRMQESTPIDPQQDVQVVTKLETTRSKGPEGRIVMINHFEKRAMIGKGQHGEVFEGFDIQTSQLVVSNRSSSTRYVADPSLMTIDHRPSKLCDERIQRQTR